MFWGLVRQILRASRGRLAVALAALVSGAAVTSALLNLQLDAERKLTREFRTLGANLVVAPQRPRDVAGTEPALMSESALVTIAAVRTPGVVAAAPYLYLVARVASGRSVIVAGTWLDEARRLNSWWRMEGTWIDARENRDRCLVGRNVARQLGLAPGGAVELGYADRVRRLTVAGVTDAGGSEDNQIFVSLTLAQELAALPGRIGLVQMSVRGSPRDVETFASRLAERLPGLEVRPVRQITEAEGRLLDRIRGLILATVTLILSLTTLSLLATMASLALERRQDVGLMKALGGSTQRVVQLFLVEVGVLGLGGGLGGYALGLALGSWIGRSVFDAPVTPRLEVLPLTVALMVAVSMAGALPLRLLGRVSPAVILRGE